MFSSRFRLFFKAAACLSAGDHHGQTESHDRSPRVHMWKLTHPQMIKPSYLIGTMHVPWKILYDEFPANIERAIKQTDWVVTERKLTASALAECFKRRGPSKLPPDILERVKKVAPSKLLEYLPMDWLCKALSDMLLKKSIQSSGLLGRDSPTFDDKIVQIGESNGKGIRHLEDIDDVCTRLPNVSEETLLLLIKHTLNRIEADENLMKRWVELYKKGKLTKEKPKLLIEDNGQEYKEQLKKALAERTSDIICVRNNRWINKMHQWMVEQNPGQESFVFAVGLAHITYPKDNLQQLLQEKGYTVEKEAQMTMNRSPSVNDEKQKEAEECRANEKHQKEKHSQK